jgi:hypothetical protein
MSLTVSQDIISSNINAITCTITNMIGSTNKILLENVYNFIHN